MMLCSKVKLGAKALRATINAGVMPHSYCEPTPVFCPFYKV